MYSVEGQISERCGLRRSPDTESQPSNRCHGTGSRSADQSHAEAVEDVSGVLQVAELSLTPWSEPRRDPTGENLQGPRTPEGHEPRALQDASRTRGGSFSISCRSTARHHARLAGYAKDGSTDVFGRLGLDLPCSTIVRVDKPEKGRYRHPSEDRPITASRSRPLLRDPRMTSSSRATVDDVGREEIGTLFPQPLRAALAERDRRGGKRPPRPPAPGTRCERTSTRRQVEDENGQPFRFGWALARRGPPGLPPWPANMSITRAAAPDEHLLRPRSSPSMPESIGSGEPSDVHRPRAACRVEVRFVPGRRSSGTHHPMSARHRQDLDTTPA